MKNMKNMLLILVLGLIIGCGGSGGGNENNSPQQISIDPWPNGIINYTINPDDFTNYEIYKIYFYLDEMENRTDYVIIFNEIEYDDFLENSEYVVEISKVNGGKSCSTVGYQKYPYIELSKVNESIVKHEFMHAIGFYHEFQRADRDKYVNCGGGSNYDIRPTLYDINQFDYDVESITLFGYDNLDFKVQHYTKGTRLSKGDVLKIKSIY